MPVTAFLLWEISVHHTNAAADTREDSVIVAELKLQLESDQGLHPKVSAVLNITPDHSNRHRRWRYIRAKMNIMKNQTLEDISAFSTLKMKRQERASR